VPAVALTAWALPRDRARAKDAGFQAHLVKPVDPSTLVSVVGALAVKGGGEGAKAS
jgi:CheY-like chemotaxis protein